MDLYNRLMELGNRLKDEGRKDDASLIYLAAGFCMPQAEMENIDMNGERYISKNFLKEKNK